MTETQKENLKDTKQDVAELYRIRGQIASQINLFRGRYGNKDGISSDGSYRRYDNSFIQAVEDRLYNAITEIFQAEETLRACEQHEHMVK